MSCYPDKPILAGFLGSVAACPLPALAGRHDGRYMSDTAASQHPVFELHNSTFATSTCSLIKLSQKTEGLRDNGAAAAVAVAPPGASVSLVPSDRSRNCRAGARWPCGRRPSLPSTRPCVLKGAYQRGAHGRGL